MMTDETNALENLLQGLVVGGWKYANLDSFSWEGFADNQPGRQINIWPTAAFDTDTLGEYPPVAPPPETGSEPGWPEVLPEAEGPTSGNPGSDGTMSPASTIEQMLLGQSVGPGLPVLPPVEPPPVSGSRPGVPAPPPPGPPPPTGSPGQAGAASASQVDQSTSGDPGLDGSLIVVSEVEESLLNQSARPGLPVPPPVEPPPVTGVRPGDPATPLPEPPPPTGSPGRAGAASTSSSQVDGADGNSPEVVGLAMVDFGHLGAGPYAGDLLII